MARASELARLAAHAPHQAIVLTVVDHSANTGNIDGCQNVGAVNIYSVTASSKETALSSSILCSIGHDHTHVTSELEQNAASGI